MVKLHAVLEFGVDGTLAQFFWRDYGIKIHIHGNHGTQRNRVMGSHRLIPRRGDCERILTRRKPQRYLSL
jgi:hypothetical protein